MSSSGLRSRKTRAVCSDQIALTDYAKHEPVLEHLQEPDSDGGVTRPGADATRGPIAAGGIESQARRFHPGDTTRFGPRVAGPLCRLALARLPGRVAHDLAKHPER